MVAFFLPDRSIYVIFGSNRTPWATVPYGLPKDLASLLFVLYAAGIGGILQLFGVSPHQFAGDTQAHGDTQAKVHGPSSSVAQMVDRLLEVSSALDAWLSSNRLWLNPEKMQFMWLQLEKINTATLHLRFSHIQFFYPARGNCLGSYPYFH